MSVAPGGSGPALPTRELEAIAEASRVLSSTLDLTEVLDRLAAIAQARLDVAVVRIWLVDEASGTVVLRSQMGTLKEHVAFSPTLPSGEGLVGWVIAQGRPLAVADAREDPRLVNRTWFQAEGVISILTVPIVLGGAPIGALACMSRRRREFTPADIALAEAVAAPAATAVRNATLYTDALARLEEIQAAQRVISDSLAAPDLPAVLTSVVREVRRLLGSEAACCSLVDPRTLEVDVAVAQGARSPDFPRYRAAPGRGFMGLVIGERRSVRTDAYLEDPRFTRDEEQSRWARREEARAVIAAPVVDPAGQIIAVLWGYNRGRATFTPAHEERLGRLAQQAALAIGKTRSLEDERRRARETAALLEIARACVSTLELRPLLREVAQLSAQALGVERCSIYLSAGDRLRPIMSQFADGHSDPEQWARFKGLQAGDQEAPLHTEAVRLRQPVAIEDALASPIVPAGWVQRFGIRAALVVPLVAKDEVIGTLDLDDTRGPRAWSRAQVDLATTIAAQVALAVSNARNFGAAQQRAGEVEALAAAGEALASTLDLSEVLEAVARGATQLTGAQRAVVYEMDHATSCLHARAVLGIAIQPGMTLRPGQGAAGAAAARREPVWSADVLAEPPPGYDQVQAERGVPLAELAREFGYRGILAVPVASRDTVLGAICIYWDQVHRAQEREIRLLSALARQAAVAMDNARLVRDLRRTLDDLRAAQDSLVRGATLRAVGELAAGAAHHLNNLLAVVLGRTQLLLMREPPEAMLQSLRTIERAARDAADTVRRIQAFSRTETGEAAQEFDLNAAVREGLDLTRPRWEHEAQLKGVRIEVAFEPGPVPGLLGRAAEIREAVANLILNAVDAMPRGGRLGVRTWRDGARALVAVTDTGVGMAEGVRRRAFEPFFTTKGVKSTGLGLPVAYGIVRRHGGEIALDSGEGRGTTVTFWLPIGRADAAAPPPPAGVPASILVIDDEAPVRDLVMDVLAERGHQVTAAAGGREGLERFDSGRYALVITDLGMPDMTGWEVARAINGRSPETPVLLLTGWGERVQVPEGTRVAGVLTKPFDVDRLTAAVARALGGRA